MNVIREEVGGGRCRSSVDVIDAQERGLRLTLQPGEKEGGRGGGEREALRVFLRCPPSRWYCRLLGGRTSSTSVDPDGCRIAARSQTRTLIRQARSYYAPLRYGCGRRAVCCRAPRLRDSEQAGQAEDHQISRATAASRQEEGKRGSTEAHAHLPGGSCANRNGRLMRCRHQPARRGRWLWILCHHGWDDNTSRQLEKEEEEEQEGWTRRGGI